MNPEKMLMDIKPEPTGEKVFDFMADIKYRLSKLGSKIGLRIFVAFNVFGETGLSVLVDCEKGGERFGLEFMTTVHEITQSNVDISGNFIKIFESKLMTG